MLSKEVIKKLKYGQYDLILQINIITLYYSNLKFLDKTLRINNNFEYQVFWINLLSLNSK